VKPPAKLAARVSALEARRAHVDELPDVIEIVLVASDGRVTGTIPITIRPPPQVAR
jgi:hypothetical protein